MDEITQHDLRFLNRLLIAHTNVENVIVTVKVAKGLFSPSELDSPNVEQVRIGLNRLLYHLENNLADTLAKVWIYAKQHKSNT